MSCLGWSAVGLEAGQESRAGSYQRGVGPQNGCTKWAGIRTKYIGGHSDLLGGAVCCSAERRVALRSAAVEVGGAMQPFDRGGHGGPRPARHRERARARAGGGEQTPTMPKA